MEWIPAKVRLPDTRRRVWVWGFPRREFPIPIERAIALGIATCNIGRGGHPTWYFERGWFSPFNHSGTVTHWAEIVGPDGARVDANWLPPKRFQQEPPFRNPSGPAED